MCPRACRQRRETHARAHRIYHEPRRAGAMTAAMTATCLAGPCAPRHHGLGFVPEDRRTRTEPANPLPRKLSPPLYAVALNLSCSGWRRGGAGRDVVAGAPAGHGARTARWFWTRKRSASRGSDVRSTRPAPRRCDSANGGPGEWAGKTVLGLEPSASGCCSTPRPAARMLVSWSERGAWRDSADASRHASPGRRRVAPRCVDAVRQAVDVYRCERAAGVRFSREDDFAGRAWWR